MSNDNVTERKAVTDAARTGTPAKPMKQAKRTLHTFIKTRRDQASQIWDGPKGMRMLATFSRRGICRTRNPKAVARLRELGYVEVLDGQQLIPTPLAEPDPRILRAIEAEYADDEGLCEDPEDVAAEADEA
jgi:hypothetical protein